MDGKIMVTKGLFGMITINSSDNQVCFLPGPRNGDFV